jgi:hypothetical protein
MIALRRAATLHPAIVGHVDGAIVALVADLARPR